MPTLKTWQEVVISAEHGIFFLQGQGQLLDVLTSAKSVIEANLDGERHMFTNNADYLTSLVSLKMDVITEDSLLKAADKSSKSSSWKVPNWGSKAQEDDADMATRTCQAKYMDGVGHVLLFA